jgi:poly(3-hydroxybutyrate) depolymerase
MTHGRFGLLVLVTAAALGGACASEDPGTTTGSGGTNASGAAGTSAQAGTTGGAGTVGSAGTVGAAGTNGRGGVTGNAGTTATAGTNGTAGTVGAAGTTGTAGTTGAAGTGAGGTGTAGTTGVAGTSATAGAAGTSAAGSGGRAGGGGTGRGGTSGMAGAGGGATGTGGAIPLKNPPVLSAGCGKPTTVTTGKKTITSGGQSRSYIIDIPSNYDMNKPYRFFYTSHWISSTAEAVRDQNYYFLKPLATAANEPAIFLAPQALPGNPNGTWDTSKNTDHILFDDLLAYVKANLCIDTTRVFATGFSFGGMMTYSLSVNHQKDIRAAVGIAPANYNIYVPPKTHAPIAWMQTTGMSDGTCPWVNGSSTTQGSKFIAIEHGTDNGCMVPATIPTWQSGNHLCYDIPGCKPEFPTKVCTFNGGHTNIANESGTNWIPTESWKFFTQF